MNHYFNSNILHHPYTHSLPDTSGTLPPVNALRAEPVFQEGFCPCEKDGAWIQVEDNRGKKGFVHGVETEIFELGPLPEGWSDTLPPPSLEEVKEQAREALKAYRQQVEYNGFTLNGQHWDSEQKDELRLNSAYKLFEAGLTEYPGWKIGDGVYITLTLQILKDASMAFMQHAGNAFAVELAKQAEIAALETREDVLAWIDTELEKGWGSNEAA